MGKSDEKQTKKRAHKATDGESKNKNKPSFDATNFEATNDEGTHHSQWRDHFRQLCEFKVQFGHCLVAYRYAANLKLGQWVATQRTQHKLHQKGKPSRMTDEYIRALDGIGFDWGIWNLRLGQLCEFKVQFGHSVVPQKYADNPKLGRWVSKQRREYRLHQEGEPSLMTEGRIRDLKSIGFEWETSKTGLASIWNVRIQEIREFKEQFGHCLVPQLYAANHKLGQWVSTQRKNYRWLQEGKPSSMTEDRIRELESIGFDWGTSKTDLASIWSVRIQQLCEFKAEFGHCLVPNQYSANPKLGRWVSKQRSSYRLQQKGKPSSMTEERIRELESIGFDWGTSKTDLISTLFVLYLRNNWATT
jgi:hypothetical protein